MKSRYILFLFFFSFWVSNSTSAQPKTNYQIIDFLVGCSADKLSENLNDNLIYQLVFDSASDYEVLKANVIKTISENGIKCIEGENQDNKINYLIEEAKVYYSDIFRDGIFGEFLVSREASLRGKYQLISENIENSSYNEFNHSFVDTLLYSDISKVENIAYPFTTSNIPEEPFFSSALEPAIAIGTAAVAVYLFFNIRSK